MTTDWETAVVNSDGTKFAFLDSGEAEGKPEAYTTIVCVHGHSFHARNFERLFPAAASRNLRIIAFNRRDYVGSTPFSQTELDAINGSDSAAHASFLRDRAMEIAQFLVWLVKEKRVQKAGEDGTAGGLAIMGWSLGNVFAVAFLRHLATYPTEIVQELSPYLRTAFIYESSYSGLGYPRLEKAYHPLVDPDIPERARGVAFGTWVSSYFTHPCYDALADPSYKSLSSLELRAPDPGAETKRPTIEVFTGEELKASVDTAPDLRSERAFWAIVQPEVLYENTLGTFICPNLPLPPVKICFIYCLSSVWSAQWAVSELEKDIEKWKAGGRKLRELHFVAVEGGNHFLHYEEPDRFLQILAEGISS